MASSDVVIMGEPDVIEDEIVPEMDNELKGQEEMETRTEMIARDLILEEPGPSKNRQKEKQKAKQRKLKLEKKLDLERRREEKLLNNKLKKGWPITIKNIRLWVLIMCIVFFIKGMTEQYILVIKPVLTIEMRHKEIEVAFFSGLEVFGVLITLVFISFYAGVIRKPWAIFAGVLVMFISNIFFLIPPFLISNSMTLKGPAVTHIETSLCNPQDENVACDKQLKVEDKTRVFSLICVSRILSGIGIGIVMPLCISHIYDNALQTRTAIFIGLVICSNWIGQFIGAVLGQTVPYASLVMTGEPWVIVFIVAAIILLVISIFIPPFPTWFDEVPSYAKIRLPKVSLMAQPVDEQTKKRKKPNTRKIQNHTDKRKPENNNNDITHKSTTTELPTVTVPKVAKPVISESDLNDDDLEVSHVVFGNLAPQTEVDISNQTPSTHSAAPSNAASHSTASITESKKSNEIEGNDERKTQHTRKAQQPRQDSVKKQSNKTFILRNFSYFLLRQVKDPVFLLVSIGFSLVNVLFRGYYYTLATFLELEFWAPGHVQTNIISGICIPLVAAVGGIAGAIVIWRFNCSQRQLALLAAIATAIAALGFFILMAFKCHDTVLDVTKIGIGKDDSSPQSCGMECSCRKAVLTPVCHVGGNVTYGSPCHAGCHVSTNHLWTDDYIQCSCGERIQLGVCGKADTCKSLIPVAIIIAVLVFLVSSAVVPIIMLLLRNAEPKEKYIALGFCWWLSYVIGHLLGPVIFSAILVSCCLHWKELGSCTEEEDICWNYDINKLRFLQNGIMGCILVVAAGCFAGVYAYLKWKKHNSTNEKDLENYKAQIDQNDNESIKINGSAKTDHGSNDSSPEEIITNGQNGETTGIDNEFDNSDTNIESSVPTIIETTHSNAAYDGNSDQPVAAY